MFRTALPPSLALALLCLLAGPAQAQAPGKAPQRALRWTLPEGWQETPASSAMRALQLALPGELELVVYHFGKGRGGSVDDNLKRWLGQMQPEGGQSLEEATTRGLRLQHRLVIHTLDVRGTYAAAARPGGSEQVRKPGSRLLAAVVVGADGPYFVKLLGPAAKVDAVAKGYAEFLGSLHAGNTLGLALTPPATWGATPPSNRMRCAELLLPGDLPLVVYHFGEGGGGGVEANFKRWLGQLSAPQGGEVKATRAEFETQGLKVYTLDASGTYAAGMPGQAKTPKSGYRLLGAVIEGAGGPYFVKLVGPAAQVEKQREAYLSFLREGLVPLGGK